MGRGVGCEVRQLDIRSPGLDYRLLSRILTDGFLVGAIGCQPYATTDDTVIIIDGQFTHVSHKASHARERANGEEVGVIQLIVADTNLD